MVNGPITAWATESPGGRISVVLINDDPNGSYSVHLHLPNRQPALALDLLRAPSLTSTQGITLGGESFGTRTRTGVLPAQSQPIVVERGADGDYTVPVPAASAVVLTGCRSNPGLVHLSVQVACDLPR